MTVSNATVEPGETTQVEIRLSEAPDGLAGYNLTVSVTDGATGEFTITEYAPEFELTTDPRYTELNSSVQLQALDVQDPPGPNATDVLLATVTVTGNTGGDVSQGYSHSSG